MTTISWLVEVADVFLTSVIRYSHLWLLPSLVFVTLHTTRDRSWA